MLEVELEERVIERPRAAGRRPGRLVLAGTSALAVLLAGAAVLVAVLGGDDDVRSSLRRRLPEAAEVRWRTDVDGGSVTAVAATSDTVVLAVGLDAWLIALDRATGERRWAVDLARGAPSELAVLGEVVVAISYGEGATDVIGVDLATGERRWSTRFDLGSAPQLRPDGIFVTEWADDGGRGRVVRIDAGSGLTAEEWTGEQVWMTQGGVVRRDAGVVEVIDPGTGERRYRTVVGEAEAPGSGPRSSALTDVGLLVASSDGLALVHDGHVAAALDEPTAPDEAWWLVDAAGTTVFAVGPDDVRALDVSDAAIVERWSRQGVLLGVVRDDARPLAIVAPVAADGSLSAATVVDVDGDVVWEGPVSALAQTSVVPQVADGGFVADADDDVESVAGVRRIAGYDTDGRQRWRFDVHGFGETWLVDRGIVTTTIDVSTATITVTMRS